MNRADYKAICDYLGSVIDATQWEGQVFTVGGCCRDSLMDREIHDIDLAVTVPDGGVEFALWLEKKDLLADKPILFKKYSTSRLRLKEFPDHEIEVVQTRKEKYTDRTSRNPEIAFGSLEEDCFRRDLTINSLYQNVTTGELLDLTGHGEEDIRNHRIRTPLSPDIIFDDDPVRILRTIRFATRFGWEIPREILDSMKRNSQRLNIIRRERLAAEFEKMLVSPDPKRTLSLLRQVGAMQDIVPEMCRTYRLRPTSNNPNNLTLWELILSDIETSKPEVAHRYAALLGRLKLLPQKPRQKNEDAHNEEESPKLNHRSRNAIIERPLRRLHYHSDMIRRVKRVLNQECSPAANSPSDKPTGEKTRRRRRNRRRRSRSQQHRKSATAHES